MKIIVKPFCYLIKFEFFMEKLVKIFILNSQVSPSSTTKYYSLNIPNKIFKALYNSFILVKTENF